MREKLIALIRKADKEDNESLTQDVHYAFMADHLIANGVTIPVQCNDCIHFDEKKALRPGGIWCEYWGTDPDPEDWCCKGERRTDD